MAVWAPSGRVDLESKGYGSGTTAPSGRSCGVRHRRGFLENFAREPSLPLPFRNVGRGGEAPGDELRGSRRASTTTPGCLCSCLDHLLLPGTCQVWSLVTSRSLPRRRLSSLLLQPTAIALGAMLVVALVGAAVALVNMHKTVTLSVDGASQRTSGFFGTVSEVLDSEGITVGKHDVVAPSPDAKIE